MYFFLFFFFLTSTYTYIFRVTYTIIWERREKAASNEATTPSSSPAVETTMPEIGARFYKVGGRFNDPVTRN